MKVYSYLDEIEEILDTSSKPPFVKKVLVDPDEIREIIQDIKATLPDDVQDAKKLLDDKERLKKEAESEARNMIDDARDQADSLVGESRILNKARAEAEEIVEESRQFSYGMRMQTYDYVDELLFTLQKKVDGFREGAFKEFQDNLTGNLNKLEKELGKNRRELQEIAGKINENMDNRQEHARADEEEEFYE